jgi:prophage antirepressor-like protein
MDILKIFNLYDKEFPVNIIGSVEEPLFQANQIAKLLGIKNIHESIKTFDNYEKIGDIIAADSTNRKQKTTFLTEIGLYKLIFRSNKQEATLFQKWVCNIIKELRIKGKYELDTRNETEGKLLQRKLELERHKTLIASYDKKRVVYICVLDNHRNLQDTENSIYKIGWSDNFTQRFKELVKTYGPTTVLYMFEINCNRSFEKFLFNQNLLKNKRYKEDIAVHKTREVFLLSPDDLYAVLEIIRKNSSQYQNFNTDEILELKRLSNECQKLALENTKAKLEILKLQKNDDKNTIDNDIIEENIVEEDFIEYIPKTKPDYVWTPEDSLFDVVKRNNTRSPYMQKYDPNTFELLESFDSIIDLTRQDDKLSYSGLKSAVKNKSIYKNFRWFMVDKKQPNIKYDIGETKCIIKNIPNEFIAMLDINKEHIIEVYASQKHASKARKFSNGAAISKAINQGSLSSGHYWQKYDDCSEDLKATYNKPLPEKITKNTSIKVNLLHKTTKEIIKTYDSVSDLIKEFQISRLTLNKICKNKTIYKNFLFEMASE